MVHVITPAARALAAGAILGVFALGNPAPAAATDLLVAAEAASTPAPSAHAKTSRADRVEARIAKLHKSLGITPAQDKSWDAVAQAMRDSAALIEKIADQRHQNFKTMTAVDDLRSYESLSQAHADGMKKVVAAFAPLYDSMSDGQKKAADTLFRRQERHRAAAKKA
jgi:periplasmic protein CpxP/Spy